MHNLTQTTIDETTLEVTSVNSYVFTCPECKKQNRYAYSFDDKIEVYCNGEDFGTKLALANGIVEISQASGIIDLFITDSSRNTGGIAPDVLNEMETGGLIEVSTDTNECTLTDKGYGVLDEVRKEITLDVKNVNPPAQEKLREIYKKGEVYVIDLNLPDAREMADLCSILERAGLLNHLSGIFGIDTEIIYEITQLGTTTIEEVLAKEAKAETDRIAKLVAEQIIKGQ